ncbi:hypothetical protein ACLB2K_002333 [Fragaria x ananassa]
MVYNKGTVKAEDVKSFIKPLNGKDDFTLWQRRMKSVLILQDLYEAVLGIGNKAVDMADKVWQKIDKEHNRVASCRSQVDVQYEEEDKVLLTSLPASYEQFITTLVSSKDSLKYDEITEAIQSYIKTSSETESSQGGLQVKGKETCQLTSKEDKSGNKGTTKSKKKYKEGGFKCGAADHLKRNCKEGRMEAQVTAGSSSTANIVIRKDEDDCELLVVTSTSNAFRDWILDTGCTFHMCAIREWFDTFEESSSNEVFRGDDSPCRILGIGLVKIRMHDGVVRKLENVRYIPMLRKNLISLGTLDKVGYRYSSKEGRLKVIKGSLVVMKGDIQPNKLYKLQGTTIRGGVAMSTEVNDKTEQ